MNLVQYMIMISFIIFWPKKNRSSCHIKEVKFMFWFGKNSPRMVGTHALGISIQ